MPGRTRPSPRIMRAMRTIENAHGPVLERPFAAYGWRFDKPCDEVDSPGAGAGRPRVQGSSPGPNGHETGTI
jgi:hypothetical protein